MKYITFTVNGMPKHVFLNNIGFVEAAPGHSDKTRVYVQGVPLLVSGTPDVVLASILDADNFQEEVASSPPLTPEDAIFEKPKPAKRPKKERGSVNV